MASNKQTIERSYIQVEKIERDLRSLNDQLAAELQEKHSNPKTVEFLDPRTGKPFQMKKRSKAWSPKNK